MSFFGQSEKLTNRINCILQDYPEGSQILKEIIQNADDARARNIRVILDHHQYSKNKLKYPDTGEFQGPSLTIYNSGTFSDVDFDSIQQVGGSYKRNDDSKIGKFGIGFNSVYHLTDLPSIVSGKHLIIFDPHVKFLSSNNPSETGKILNFLDPLENIKASYDQASPYQVCGCQLSEYFDGTIFRLPLRTADQALQSKISRNSYDAESIKKMFSSFQEEAESILVFLRYVESIRLEEWFEGELESRLVFEVALKNSTEVRENRSEIARSLESESTSIKSQLVKSYQLEIELIQPQSTTQLNWFVCTMINFNQPNRDRRIEWVGCAAKLSSDGQPIPIEGRAFCFLPLPIATGLPVHVNGYFELSSNRRDLWKGSDAEGDVKLKVEWNVNIVANILPTIYGELLERNLLNYNTHCSWSNIWPLCAHYEIFWQPLAKNTLVNLWNRSVWWTAADGGIYCKGCEVVLYAEEDLTAISGINETINFLTANSTKLVKMNYSHITEIIKAVTNAKIFNPKYAREMIRINFPEITQMSSQFTREISFNLLLYCLSDNNINDLDRLPLLPLRNGMLVKFNIITDEEDTVFYITRSEEERVIMKNLNDILIDWDMPLTLWNKLCSDDMRASCNMQLISIETIKKYMDQLIPPQLLTTIAWETTTYNADRKWLQALWGYFSREKCDLRLFDNWSLLPCLEGRLCKLQKKPHSKFIFQRNDLLDNTLSRLGCGVILSSEFNLSHPQLEDIYVHKSNPTGILRALKGALEEKPELLSYFRSIKKEGVEALLNCFASRAFLSTICLEDLATLRKLSLFKSWNSEDPEEYVSINHPHMCIPPPGLDVSVLPDKHLFLRVSSGGDFEKELLSKLGVIVKSKASFYVEYIFSKLFQLPGKIRDAMMVQILEEFLELKRENKNIMNILGKMEFVPLNESSAVETLTRPESLYDPHESLLLELFDQNRFPAPHFCTPVTLVALRELGLKSALTTQCLLSCVRQMSLPNQSDYSISVSRSKTLLSWLNNNKSFYSEISKLATFKSQLTNEIRTSCWLPVKREICNDTTEYYLLPWQGSSSPSCLASSLEMRPLTDSLLVGATMLILDCDFTLSPELLDLLGWSSPPEAKSVIAQLQAAYDVSLTSIPDNSREISFHAIENIVEAVYNFLNNLNRLNIMSIQAIKQLLDHFPWVWTGYGFARSEYVAIKSSHDLSPYLHKLPISLTRFAPFLCRFGVKEEFDSVSLKSLLESVANEANGGAIDKKNLDIVILVLDLIASEPRADVISPLYVPTAAYTMVISSDVVYNDAQWLYHTIKNPPLMAHDRVSNAMASKFCLNTLRNHYLESQSPDSRTEKGEEFGQTEGICARIGNILRDYPDNGIIKEIIQNADDAGATVLKLLFDKRQHGTESVLSESMRSFQGPALCAYNNQPFNDEDIKNIEKLGNSSKNSELGKIGQFGLGFNSSYHITDLPMLITGEFMYIFDPHAKYAPGATSSKPGRKLSLHGFVFEDQLEPFKWFGCSSGKFFPETVFRFPLRTYEHSLKSEICGEKYSVDRIINLLQELKESSSTILLFLRSLKSIEVLVWEPEDMQPNLLFKTEAYYNDDQEERRKELTAMTVNQNYAEMLKDNHFQCSHQVRIRSWDDREDISANWLVTNVINIGEKTQTALNALAAEERKAMPYAGVAMNLSDSAIKKKDSGVFCFLPLPIKLSLPVHINSYFRLTSSRRNIWIGDEQSGTSKCWTQWNKSLIAEALPRAYACMLVEARNLFQISDAKIYYSYWPNSINLETLWVPIIKELYSILPQYELFSTTSLHGRLWKSMSYVHFQDWNDTEIDRSPVYNYLLGSKSSEAIIQEVESALLKIDEFYLCNDIPKIIVRELRHYIDEIPVKTTNISDIRNFVRSHSNSMTLEVAYVLLPYCLADVRVSSTEETADSLLGLRLLPLASGELAVIGDQDYFLAPINIINLFPANSCHLFVDGKSYEMFTNVHFQPSFFQKIRLREFDPETLAYLVESHILPRCWKGESVVSMSIGYGSPTLDWFSLFWSTIIELGYNDMSCFSSLQLIPTQSGHCIALEHAYAVINNRLTLTHEDSLVSVLIKLGSFTLTHLIIKKILPISFFTVSFEEICKMFRFSFKRLNFTFLTKQEVNELSEYLLNFGKYANEEDLEFIQTLPIFRNTRDEFVSLGSSSIWRVAPTDANMTEIAGNFLKYSHNSISYYNRCKIKELSSREFYIDFVIPVLSQLSIDAKIVHLTKIRELIGNYGFACINSTEIILKLCVLPFIPVSSCCYKAPKALYDPTDDVLCLLFADDEVFPQPPFDSPDWLHFLRMLGLSNLGNNNKVIVDCAKKIESLNGPHKLDAAKKLAKHLISLKDTEINNLPQELQNIVFFPANFQGIEQVYAPNKIALTCDEDLISFVLPTSDLIPNNLKTEFVYSLQFLHPPPLENVLNNWISLTNSTRIDINIGTLLKSIHPIMINCQAQCLCTSNKSLIYKKLASIPCIWTGTEFLPPSKVYLELEYEIRPHLYEVPKELLVYRNLLEACGVQRSPLFDDCGNILEALAQESHGTALDVNCRKIAEKSIKQLTKCQDFEKNKVMTVFLLDSENILRRGSDLVDNDADWLYQKIRADQVHIANSDLPKVILETLSSSSSAVNEIFDSEYIPKIVNSFLADMWTDNISLEAFWLAIIQIFVSENPRHDRATLTRLESALKALAEYRITFVEELRSKMILVSTEEDISANMEIKNLSFTDKGKKVIYAVQSATSELPPIFYVSREVSSLLGFTIPHLERILDCDPHELVKKLLLLGIKKTHIKPDPVVGEELYPWDERLVEDLEAVDNLSYPFVDDEWVVWVDASDEYLYGKIIREEVDVNMSTKRTRLSRKYLVNTTGNETKVISGSYLWKLRSDNDMLTACNEENISVVSNEGLLAASTAALCDTYNKERNERSSMPLVEKMNRVNEMIAEIWGLPMDEQKPAFNRLFLKWHPDKNHGDKDFNEVFKHIREEMERGPRRERADVSFNNSFPQNYSSNFGTTPVYSGATRNDSYYAKKENDSSDSTTTNTQEDKNNSNDFKYSTQEGNYDRNQWWFNFDTTYNNRRSTSSRNHRRTYSHSFHNRYNATSSSSYCQNENIRCNRMCPVCCPR